MQSRLLTLFRNSLLSTSSLLRTEFRLRWKQLSYWGVLIAFSSVFELPRPYRAGVLLAELIKTDPSVGVWDKMGTLSGMPIRSSDWRITKNTWRNHQAFALGLEDGSVHLIGAANFVLM
ncbi:hypothetical protein TNCV_40051 [Trichonephila clavipes]|nr:hypothetical protein TNCV_40051 [Trichonephila clavipes]